MKTSICFGKSARSERGGILIGAVLVVFTLAAIAASVFGVSAARNREANRVGAETRALYLADAGLSEALLTVAQHMREGKPVPASIGSIDAPIVTRKGSFWCDITENVDGSFAVVSQARAGTSDCALEARIQEFGAGVFDHAIFAGNSDNDPTYTLKLSGVGTEADSVSGDIYSGNDVDIQDDAYVKGDIAAVGTITGAAGSEGESRTIPDIAAMAYETNHDVDVAASFAASQSWKSDALGGSAYQVPETDPAHIFRKNPDDRPSETSSTTKDDYFLEDPYEKVSNYSSAYGGYVHTVSLAGVNGEPGKGGNEVVYFIDGNVWVHNKSWLRMQFNRGSDPTKVTFIVKGNVYFSDDVTTFDPSSDGVAFVAIKDDKEQDSGNIYLGDPRFGTVEMLNTFLYAENDFIDYNLDAKGSKDVTITGTMTAGNRVAIERDFVTSGGSTVHSQLTVDYDDRISTGALEMPGISGSFGGSGDTYGIVLWREVALQ